MENKKAYLVDFMTSKQPRHGEWLFLDHLHQKINV
jgi:hypothetical protein